MIFLAVINSLSKPSYHRHLQRSRDEAIGPYLMEQAVVFPGNGRFPANTKSPAVQSPLWSIVAKGFTDTPGRHTKHHKIWRWGLLQGGWLAICCRTYCGKLSGMSANKTVIQKLNQPKLARLNDAHLQWTTHLKMEKKSLKRERLRLNAMPTSTRFWN